MNCVGNVCLRPGDLAARMCPENAGEGLGVSACLGVLVETWVECELKSIQTA